ncbi:hypothetical protein CsatB_012258 [Cannabis sativa]|jgi:hypothetical protein|uniref:Uncharacterized protein n=2 Tax=Cannabis sativa TaxID=3483 RepID=A0A7J6HUR0_CANSA|nr:hypothetical protein F8388_023941 [Cannabis sativa]KAF4398120.1 hypothetical protein G4B88_019841 [Cannabis sativa]KAF4399244.1 hypothetical protein G4B88_022327 [Cannabis sativa]
MSVKKTLSLNRGEAAKGGEISEKRSKKYGRCFSFMEVRMEAGKTLKEMDSNKLKYDIKRWAKAVVAYARQVSGRFGGSRT